LIKDLKQRGLLDDTLVVWGSEFGRTPGVDLRGIKVVFLSVGVGPLSTGLSRSFSRLALRLAHFRSFRDTKSADILRSAVITIKGLLKIMLGEFTHQEDSIIDRAITETYALKDITADSNFANIEPHLLTDFEMVLAGMEGSGSLIQRLVKFTHGSWASFLNEPSNVDINRKFVVFSVRDMEDELKPVAMYIVTHYIWNAIRKNLRKRLLVVDEAWWMMKSEDTASFLYSIAKRGRNYYLGLATITHIGYG